MLSTEEDRKMSTMLLDLWTSYADTGYNNAMRLKLNNLTLFFLFYIFCRVPRLPNNIGWPRVSRSLSDPVKYLHIKSPTQLEIESASDLGNQKFWSSLPLKENEKLHSALKEEL